jgi:glycosyltransferase involved in cell wall biosynthesis
MSAIPKVSIILPVYNGLNYLGRSINSIVDQTYTNWELIIVDDGSTDGSVNYIRSHVVPNLKSRVIFLEHTQNQGIAQAYNTGIAAASGQFIAFQEQDDISLEHRLATQVETIKNLDVALLTSQVRWIDEDGIEGQLWPGDYSQDIEVFQPGKELFEYLLINQTIFANTTTLINRDAVDGKDLRFDSGFQRSGQDWDLHLRFAQKYRMARLREVLVFMQRDEKHISSTSNKLHVFADNRRILRKHLLDGFRIVSPRPSSVIFKAWSYEFLREARYIRGIKGGFLGILALFCWPFNKDVWVSSGNAIRLLSSINRHNRATPH